MRVEKRRERISSSCSVRQIGPGEICRTVRQASNLVRAGNLVGSGKRSGWMRTAGRLSRDLSDVGDAEEEEEEEEGERRSE
jgi:hypothetical protein